MLFAGRSPLAPGVNFPWNIQLPNLISPSSGSGGAWGAVGSVAAAPTVTANTADVIAPDGSRGATKAVYPATTAAGQFSLINQFNPSVTSGSTYTLSMFLLGTGSQTFFFAIDGNGFGPQATKTCALTAAWQRFALTWTATGSGNGPGLNIGSDTRAGNANEPTMSAQTVYLWGIQLNLGTYASPIRLT